VLFLLDLVTQRQVASFKPVIKRRRTADTWIYRARAVIMQLEVLVIHVLVAYAYVYGPLDFHVTT